MSSVFQFIVLTFLKLTSSYWLSANQLTWNASDEYCQRRCNSSLASIHTDQEGEWSGSVLWNDNHVAFENGGALFETKYGNGPLNVDNNGNPTDNLFIHNDGEDTNSTNAMMQKLNNGDAGSYGTEDNS